MLRQANTALTTVGAGLILGAALKGQFITRSGPTGAFTDTTDTAANILSAFLGMYNIFEPVTFAVQYVNTTAYTATLAAGAGVTIAANTGTTLNVAAGAIATILVTMTPAAGTVALSVLWSK